MNPSYIRSSPTEALGVMNEIEVNLMEKDLVAFANNVRNGLAVIHTGLV